MGKVVPYQVEYTIRSSPTILFNFLSSPSGLAQWFADHVDIKDDECTFEWNGSEEKAYIVEWEEDELIRFRWEYDDDDQYFEFRVTKSEVTGDTILVVTDFADETEVEDQQRLWDSQIDLLIQQVGGRKG